MTHNGYNCQAIGQKSQDLREKLTELLGMVPDDALVDCLSVELLDRGKLETIDERSLKHLYLSLEEWMSC